VVTIPDRLVSFILITLLISFTFVFFIFFKGVDVSLKDFFTNALTSSSVIRENKPITFLICGIDKRFTNRRRTDTIIYAKFFNGKLKMVSIPRDLIVNYYYKTMKLNGKINSVYENAGIDSLEKVVESLGFKKPDFYFIFDFSLFQKVVDDIGGVDIYIDKAMHYDDNAQNLHIHFLPGFYHLNGQKALEYIRFRKDRLADIARIKRQQNLIDSIVRKMNLMSGTQIMNLYYKIRNYIKDDTNFNMMDAIAFYKYFNYKSMTIETMSLPTHFTKGSYVLLDKNKLNLVYDFLNDKKVSVVKNYHISLINNAKKDTKDEAKVWYYIGNLQSIRKFADYHIFISNGVVHNKDIFEKVGLKPGVNYILSDKGIDKNFSTLMEKRLKAQFKWITDKNKLYDIFYVMAKNRMYFFNNVDYNVFLGKAY
jgi:LCP family protein required for cell wall assembly